MRSRRSSILIAVPVLALLVLGALASQNYEIVSKTKLYDADTLYEIRLFDAVTVKAKPDVKPSPDVLNSLLLVIAATLSLGTAVLLHMLAAAARPKLFFAVVAAGAYFLAGDELMGGHESIGYNLEFLADLPGIDRADDAVVVAYGLVALAIVILFRDVILGARGAMKYFAAAVVILGLASLLDVLAVPGLEEMVEILGSLVGLLGFGALALHYLREAGVIPEARAAN